LRKPRRRRGRPTRQGYPHFSSAVRKHNEEPQFRVIEVTKTCFPSAHSGGVEFRRIPPCKLVSCPHAADRIRRSRPLRWAVRACAKVRQRDMDGVLGPRQQRQHPADSHIFTDPQYPCNTRVAIVASDVIRGRNMRRKHLAWLGRVPANCNHKGLQASPVARNWRWLPGDTQVPGGDQPGRMHRPGRWGDRVSCVSRVSLARRHRARQLLLLARELCASAALHEVGGRRSVSSRALRLACDVLRGRAGISEPGRGQN